MTYHEEKQKLNSIIKRYKKALSNHPDKDLIQKEIQMAIGRSAEPISVFQLGILMTSCHSGQVILSGDEGDVTIKWGRFAQNESEIKET